MICGSTYPADLSGVHRTSNARRPAVERMRADYRGHNNRMSEQFPDRPNVGIRYQQMCSERMPEHATCRIRGQSRGVYSRPHGLWTRIIRGRRCSAIQPRNAIVEARRRLVDDPGHQKGAFEHAGMSSLHLVEGIRTAATASWKDPKRVKMPHVPVDVKIARSKVVLRYIEWAGLDFHACSHRFREPFHDPSRSHRDEPPDDRPFHACPRSSSSMDLLISDFGKEMGKPNLWIDFERGSRFPYPSCGGENCPVHDTAEKRWRHLNVFRTSVTCMRVFHMSTVTNAAPTRWAFRGRDPEAGSPSCSKPW